MSPQSQTSSGEAPYLIWTSLMRSKPNVMPIVRPLVHVTGDIFSIGACDSGGEIFISHVI